MALELPSGAHLGCNRHCKTNPVDLEGSGGQVLVDLRGFVLGRFYEGGQFSVVAKGGYVFLLDTRALFVLARGPPGQGEARFNPRRVRPKGPTRRVVCAAT